MYRLCLAFVLFMIVMNCLAVVETGSRSADPMTGWNGSNDGASQWGAGLL